MSSSRAKRPKDGVLVLVGITIFYVIYTLHFGLSPSSSRLRIVQRPMHTQDPIQESDILLNGTAAEALDSAEPTAILETHIIAHAPGWTIFRDLYMSNGTLYIVAPEARQADLPPLRMLTSTGLEAFNTPENIAMREPTSQEIQVITPQVAQSKWGVSVEDSGENRIWSIEGFTFLVNEPGQFLAHYYHFVAELFFGAWAFLYGAFNPYPHLKTSNPYGITSSPDSINFTMQEYTPPTLSRIIFMHATSDGWRDVPGFNSYFLRAAFPSLTVEVSDDWDDRVAATSHQSMGPQSKERAWHFPMVLLSDRSAAFRGEACGSRTHRIASESWEPMIRSANIDVHGGWWNVLREKVLEFAGVKPMQIRDTANQKAQVSEEQSLLDTPDQIVITYLSRQGGRRRLIQEDHDSLVQSLTEMTRRKRELSGKDWILRVVEPERLSKDEQVELASKTTILLGVHGNGLTHLVLMKPNRWSTVIELFYPGGFAHDYEWTTRALGMKHYIIWNDTYSTHPHEPPVLYPEGFQGTSIPVHGDTVARLIEDRLEGIL